MLEHLNGLSQFEAHLDPTGIALILERPGTDDVHKSIHTHVNFGRFADILREVASTVGRIPKDDVMHRNLLTKAVAELHAALAEFSTLIAFQTNATKRVLIGRFLTEEEAASTGLSRQYLHRSSTL